MTDANRFPEWMYPGTIMHAVPTRWHWVVWRPEYFKLGSNTDIGAFTCIFAHHGVEIGDDVQIGSHCSIYSLNTIENKRGRVVIGKGACIGSHSTIMTGVTIGEGAIVGAHSLVLHDVAPGAKVFGTPAKPRL